METREKILKDIKYMTDELTEINDIIQKGCEAIEEKKRIETKLEMHMILYLGLGSKLDDKVTRS